MRILGTLSKFTAKMHSAVLRLIFLQLLTLIFCGLSSATALDKIVVFGDSLSDNGNLYEYMKHQLPVSPPYYEGRFTNGPVWVEILTEKYFPGDVKAHLLDYAFGGAGVAGENTDIEDENVLFTLRNEVDSYLLAHHDKANDHSLYVMWMGANNYLAMPEDLDQTIKDVNWGINASLERLIQKGARHFLIINLPDLGITPTARDFDAVDFFKYCSIQHNLTLSQNIEKLKQAYPDVTWVYYDVYRVLNEVLQNPTPYGFTNVTDTCYEAVIDNPLRKSVLNMVATIRSPLKKDACDGYLFFDPVHPSGPAHRILAERLWDLFREQHLEFR